MQLGKLGTQDHQQTRNINVSPRKGKAEKKNSLRMNSLWGGGEKKEEAAWTPVNTMNTKYPALKYNFVNHQSVFLREQQKQEILIT